MVEEHFVTANGTGHIRPLWRGGVSFFDALYECGAFEQKERLLKKTPATEIFGDEDTLALPHYLRICKDAGQAWDSHDMPLPTAGGHVLLKEIVYIDSEARKTVKKSRDIVLSPTVEPDPLKNSVARLMDSLESPPNETGTADSAHTSLDENIFLKSTPQSTLYAAIDVRDAIHAMIKRNFISLRLNCYEDSLYHHGKTIFFAHLFFDLFVTPLTAGKRISFDSTDSRLEGNFPELNFKYLQKKLRESAEQIPDQNIRTMMLDFSKSAQAAKHLEHAACYRENAQQQTKKEKIMRILSKGLEQVELGGKALGLSPEDTDRLKHIFSTNAFPAQKHFLDDLDKKLDKIKISLNPR